MSMRGRRWAAAVTSIWQAAAIGALGFYALASVSARYPASAHSIVDGANAGAGSLAPDVERFHDRLAEHGSWITSKTHGTVWMPRTVPHAWRPYSNGHWIYTDVEWTWVSDDPWGWATDHYGRWTYDASDPAAPGWIWIPGDEWAPAWVVWRWGGGYVGWAPLPPDAKVASDVDLDVTVEPLAFCFVRQEFLLDEHVSRRLEPVARNVTFLAAAKSMTRYTVNEGNTGNGGGVGASVVNHGVPVEEIEKATDHAVKRLPRPSMDPPPPSKAELKAKEKREKEQPETPRMLGRRHAKERDVLNLEEHDERKSLELLHRQERSAPPEGVYGGALRARQDAEDEAQREHEKREWQQMDARQKREGLGKEPPAASAHHHHQPKHPGATPPPPPPQE